MYRPGLVTVARNTKLDVLPSRTKAAWVFQAPVTTPSLKQRAKALVGWDAVKPTSLKVGGEIEFELNESAVEKLQSSRGKKSWSDGMKEDLGREISQEITESKSGKEISKEVLEEEISKALSARLGVPAAVRIFDFQIETKALSQKCDVTMPDLQTAPAGKTWHFVSGMFLEAFIYGAVALAVILLLMFAFPELLHLIASIGHLFV